MLLWALQGGNYVEGRKLNFLSCKANFFDFRHHLMKLLNLSSLWVKELNFHLTLKLSLTQGHISRGCDITSSVEAGRWQLSSSFHLSIYPAINICLLPRPMETFILKQSHFSISPPLEKPGTLIPLTIWYSLQWAGQELLYGSFKGEKLIISSLHSEHQ